MQLQPASSRKPTVWIVNEGGHDYSPAKEYGTLVSMTEGRINVFRPDRLAKVLSSKIESAREGDFLLLSGPPMANALAITLWLLRFPHVETLQWSMGKREYIRRTVKRSALTRLVGGDT